MEFKGTKGKWEVDKHNNVSSNYNEIAFLKSDTPNKERRANALLISKAPEMLDMLKEILYSDSDISEVYVRAQRLIKEATEL